MSQSRKQYPFDLIEQKWQQAWSRQETFRAWNPGDPIPHSHPFARRHNLPDTRAHSLPPKYYILDMFPYPSGAGLHVGHPEGYTATDILARYRRALGFNVLHPIGWDAFGLPAEQYAIKTRQHPRKTTEANIATFKRQIQSLGFSYDWSREVDTTDPRYFKWTQWIFLQLYNSWFNPVTRRAEPISTLKDPSDLKTDAERRAWRDSKRLAYVSEAPVNWCPELGTVLANEEVIDGKSEVGDFPVIRKPMRQWMLRITAYAERLLDDLDSIDWSDSLKEMQRNWIGRSEGAEVVFPIADSAKSIPVFTTRPDTLFGATYMVLAPEHPLVDELATPEQRNAVRDYKAGVARKSDLERTELARDKTGVFTGSFAINPVTQKPIPIWIADYVLATYGTGAIMAVPGHDTRDLEFARKFGLPILKVVEPPAHEPWEGFIGEGIAVNSPLIDGLPTPEAKRKIIDWLEQEGRGRRTINYKLRDWLFSRQRYWGEPFPIVWRTDPAGHLQHEALPESDLPVLPPPLDDYKPTPDGRPPLARATDWMTLPDGSTRETNTMPQWAGSCWYYLRYLDARNETALCDPRAERYWMGITPPSSSPAHGDHASSPDPKPTPGVDLYVGGTEHAVLHLLYARFWHKVLFDLGHVSTPEPFYKLVNQGIILGELEFFAFVPSRGSHRGFVTASDISTITEWVDFANVDAGPTFLSGVNRTTKEEVVGLKLKDGEQLVEKRGEHYYLKSRPEIRVLAASFKMSKARGNVVNPDDMVKEYGADAFRLYEMFMGPLEMVKPWNTKGVEGVYRFLGRAWRLFIDEASHQAFEQAVTAGGGASSEALLDLLRLNEAITESEPSPDQLKVLHACIKKVTEDLNGLRFNTAISALMVFVNEALNWETRPRVVLAEFLVLLQPFAPHLAEELWSRLMAREKAGPRDTALALAYQPWPGFDPALLVEDTLEIPVQVNGKLRDRITVPATASRQDLETAALASEKARSFYEGKTVRKIIVVPGKLVNIVTD